MKTFVVSEPIYKTETLFVVGCSFEAFKARLKQRYRLDAGDYIGQIGQMFTFTSQKPPCRVVWADKVDAPVVLHEVFHLVTRICDDRGILIKAHIEHGESGDEAAAFLFEFFARIVLKKLK